MHFDTYLRGDDHSFVYLGNQSGRRWPGSLPFISPPIWEKMAIHFNTHLGGDGHLFSYLLGKPTWEEMAKYSHTYLGEDCHSFPHLSRRKLPFIPIPFMRR